MGKEAAAEAYQRLFHIVKQTRPWSLGGFLTRDKDVIGAADAKNRQKGACGLAQAAAGPVADDGVPDLLGRGKSGPGFGAGGVPAASLHDDQVPALGITLCDKKKFTPHPEAQDLKWRRVLGRFRRDFGPGNLG